MAKASSVDIILHQLPVLTDGLGYSPVELSGPARYAMPHIFEASDDYALVFTSPLSLKELQAQFQEMLGDDGRDTLLPGPFHIGECVAGAGNVTSPAGTGRGWDHLSRPA